jgi:hypothetical protein
MANLLPHRVLHDSLCKTGTAFVALTLCLAASANRAFGQTTNPPQPTEPVHKAIPVHLDATTGLQDNASDALVITNAVGNYPFKVSDIAKNLEMFGGQVYLEQSTFTTP